MKTLSDCIKGINNRCGFYDMSCAERREYIAHYGYWLLWRIYRDKAMRKMRYSEKELWCTSFAYVTGCNPVVLQDIISDLDYRRIHGKKWEAPIIAQGYCGLDQINSFVLFYNRQVPIAAMTARLGLEKRAIKRIKEDLVAHPNKFRKQPYTEWCSAEWFDCICDILLWFHELNISQPGAIYPNPTYDWQEKQFDQVWYNHDDWEEKND